MSKQIAIIGASGHGKVVADIAAKNGYDEIIFLDDNKVGQKCGRFVVTGMSKDMINYKDFDFIVAIGNAEIRQKIFGELEFKQLHICTLIHPNAVVAEDVSIGTGTVVMAGSVINSGTKIGKSCIINTCSSVDHDCRIGDFVHIAVGSHVAGTVEVGNRTWIGAGTVIINNIKIICDCMIGAGSVVVKNINEAGTYIGVPARRIR